MSAAPYAHQWHTNPRILGLNSNPVLIRGLFGIERRVKFVGLGLDDPDGFRREIDARKVVDVFPDVDGPGTITEPENATLPKP